MEQTNQTPVAAKPADERKAWVKPEMSTLDVESGQLPGSEVFAFKGS